MYYGGVIKFDQHGNYVFAKIFSNGPNSGQEKFFQGFYLTIVPENEVVINGRVSFYKFNFLIHFC